MGDISLVNWEVRDGGSKCQVCGVSECLRAQTICGQAIALRKAGREAGVLCTRQRHFTWPNVPEQGAAPHLHDHALGHGA